MAEVDVFPPSEGEVQVRNRWMSVDPYMRGRMTSRKSYVPPFVIGEVLQGGAIGTVVASNSDRFAPGDLVQSMLGWREVFNAKAEALQTMPKTSLPPEALLGVAGLPGLTGYVGLTKIIGIQAGLWQRCP